ncbi:hypothetical protein IMZ31_18945 (plasmid) [Pontibacillus sp. ALD_SL1]|uniref:ZmpA/ZmpB/ZmpC family metallo-endopeptidase-related protein n=1 Tax=Pontibacillus sp. ALD_SL1 TaxID=2777185 RepID=UPI001A96BE1D|nr:ZmpA/ZmpB/ZmpC family metallo-endopeptidase-related protein [Pontibacillus sp. ALD_SL1]QST02627.1 hypothetical protein IMZ31_18945 [Pontibacillus sp. ALD_SL1]
MKYVLAFISGVFITLGGIGTVYAEPSTVITTLQELQDIKMNPDGHYVLGNDIEAAETRLWNYNGDGTYAGFEPIADFTGTLDGNGYSIRNLYINRGDEAHVGLFRSVRSGGKIQNLALENAYVKGYGAVGALWGYASFIGGVSNVFVTGTVIGDPTQSSVGGVAGYTSWGEGSNAIRDVYANVSVQAGSNVGGAFGKIQRTELIHVYSMGRVTATGKVGGAVGHMNTGPGLSTLTGVYWNKDTSGVESSPYGVPLSDEDSKNASSFAGFDFSDVWTMDEEEGYPILKTQQSKPPQAENVPPVTGVEITQKEGGVLVQWSDDGEDYETLVYRDGNRVATVDGFSYYDRDIKEEGNYIYQVFRQNALRYQSVPEQAMIAVEDITPPSYPENIHFTEKEGKLRITWSNPTEEDFDRVELYRGESLLLSGQATTYEETSPGHGVTVDYAIKTVDKKDNHSEPLLFSYTTKIREEVPFSVVKTHDSLSFGVDVTRYPGAHMMEVVREGNVVHKGDSFTYEDREVKPDHVYAYAFTLYDREGSVLTRFGHEDRTLKAPASSHDGSVVPEGNPIETRNETGMVKREQGIVQDAEAERSEEKRVDNRDEGSDAEQATEDEGLTDQKKSDKGQEAKVHEEEGSFPVAMVVTGGLLLLFGGGALFIWTRKPWK